MCAFSFSTISLVPSKHLFAEIIYNLAVVWKSARIIADHKVHFPFRKMLLSLLLVGVVVAVPNSQPNAPFNVNFSGRQILKRGNGDANPLYVYHLNETLKKYNSNVQLPTYPAINALLGTTLKKRGSNGKLTDQVENGYVDLEYYIPIKVNQQDFLVDFDTGELVSRV